MLRIFFLQTLNKYASKWLVLFVDLFLVALSFFFAYAIRFNASLDFEIAKVLYQLPIVLFLALLSFLMVGSYKGIIRHTGTKDAFNVFVGVSIYTIGLGAILLINGVFRFLPNFSIPTSIVLIHFLVATFVLVISRFMFKSFFEMLNTSLKSITNILIYGAGDSGMITYATINRDRKNNYDVIGFIDDNPNKINKKIDRIKIYSPKKITKEFIEKHDIKEIIFSMPRVKSGRLLELTDKFLNLDIKVKTIPPLSKWIEGDFQSNQIKQVNIDDLLDRDQICIDNPVVKSKVNGKVVLVTGAAGSIGSEISRQLASYNIKKLILVDQAESPLYDLQQELIQEGDDNFVPIVCDVRDRFKLERIFKKYKPDRVFHAAAYKHVPLMEKSPYEAIKINVLGTKNVADLALKYNIERFVMVSTDKAVNPTNVMGASKRIAELYIRCLSKKATKTKYTTTRFGNVLGSNGSVIPLFKKQIENGGPITVTHPEITRYFMTIPEACQLVLEAGVMGKGGEIYVFDMGESVKIVDLARKMIKLSGFVLNKDIRIKFTGLRPGEKLKEELLNDKENTIGTHNPKIMIARVPDYNYLEVNTLISNLYRDKDNLKNSVLVKTMKKIVPEYISNNSVYEKLDSKFNDHSQSIL